MTRSGTSRIGWCRSLVSGIAGILAMWGSYCFVLCPVCAASAPGWLFLPAGKDGKADYSAAQIDESKWIPAEFPHQEWEKLQPQDNVFGWYRYHFTIPSHLRGRDMWLDMGLIDDVDACFANGKPVGQSGEFPPKFKSAWTVERLYRIPAQMLNADGDNVIAVKVYDAGGVGGMMCQPMLGAALVHHGTPWRFKGCGRDGSGDFSAADLDDSTWEQVEMPDRRDNWPLTLEDWAKAPKPTKGWDARQPQDNVYGWYRLRFVAPADWKGKDILLDLGKVYDVDGTYLNGDVLGGTGHFPAGSSETWRIAPGERRAYPISSEALKLGEENVLTVKVFNTEGMGGLTDLPLIRVFPLPTAEEALAMKCRQPEGTATDMARLEELLRGLADSNDAIPARRAWSLGELCRLYAQQTKWKDVVATFNRLASAFNREACRREVVEALVLAQQGLGSLSQTVFPLGKDRETRGEWPLAYGNAGLVLCSMAVYQDLVGRPGQLRQEDPAMPSRDGEPRERPMQYRGYYHGERETEKWVHAWETKDRAALWNPMTGLGTHVWWDDLGERHPFDSKGPDLLVELQIPSGPHRLSFYFADPDWGSSSRPRLLGVVVFDRNHRALAASQTGRFRDGCYERFAVMGPASLVVRIYKHASSCAVLSGIFLDADHGPDGRLPLSEPEGESRALGEEYLRLRGVWQSDKQGHYQCAERYRALYEKSSAIAKDGKRSFSDRLVASWLQWEIAERLGLPLELQRQACSEYVVCLAAQGSPKQALQSVSELSSQAMGRYDLHLASALDRGRVGLLAEVWGTDEENSVESFERLLGAWSVVHRPELKALLRAFADSCAKKAKPDDVCRALGAVGQKAQKGGKDLVSDAVYEALKQRFDRATIVACAGDFLKARVAALLKHARTLYYGSRRQGQARCQEAQALLTGALEEYGDVEGVRNSLLLELVPVWLKLGQYSEVRQAVLELLKDARMSETSYATFLWAKAEAELMMGDMDEAVATYLLVFEQSSKFGPADGRARYAYEALAHASHVRYAQGKYADALALARKAGEHMPAFLAVLPGFPTKADMELLERLSRNMGQ